MRAGILPFIEVISPADVAKCTVDSDVVIAVSALVKSSISVVLA